MARLTVKAVRDPHTSGTIFVASVRTVGHTAFVYDRHSIEVALRKLSEHSSLSGMEPALRSVLDDLRRWIISDAQLASGIEV